jgi:hypothetical protein
MTRSRTTHFLHPCFFVMLLLLYTSSFSSTYTFFYLPYIIWVSESLNKLQIDTIPFLLWSNLCSSFGFLITILLCVYLPPMLLRYTVHCFLVKSVTWARSLFTLGRGQHRFREAVRRERQSWSHITFTWDVLIPSLVNVEACLHSFSLVTSLFTNVLMWVVACLLRRTFAFSITDFLFLALELVEISFGQCKWKRYLGLKTSE